MASPSDTAQPWLDVETAISVFGALLRRYTAEECFSIVIEQPQGALGSGERRRTSLSVDGESSMRWLFETVCGSDLLRNARRNIGCAPITLAWESDDGEQALRLTLRGPELAVVAEHSVQRGLLAGPNALARSEHHLRMLLQALREFSEQSVDAITILTTEEEHDALQGFSCSSRRPELLRDEVLHDLFEVQARRWPDRVAILFERERVTYGELNERANQMANLLNARGIGNGDCVAIQLSRGVLPYVALLGVLKAGAAYVPLDPDYPTARVAQILRDSGAKLLLTDDSIGRQHVDLSCASLVMDGDARLASFPRKRHVASVSATAPDDTCYVIYTSGTTGVPKGVEVTHRSVCHWVRAESLLFGVTSSDRVYQGLSLAFDAALEEIWLAFFAGATLVVGSKEMLVAGPPLAQWLTEHKITVLSTVPTLLALLDSDLPTVRLLILGGEACPQELAVRYCTPKRRVVNSYGPTEATVIATAGDLRPDRPVTLGRPIPNAIVYILDSHLRPLPPGAVGEICIGGVGLARGYRGSMRLTEDRFVVNPYQQLDGSERLYRTGDLGRYDAAGNILYRGRSDTQVKLRGYRIELSEIESALMSSPMVSGAVATIVTDVHGHQQLVAYVVPRGGELREGVLRSSLRARLPSYMIPALIETLTYLPMLPSGKVDRRRLPAPDPRTHLQEAAGAEPQGELEHSIAEVWNELLSTRVQRNSHFFLDLGGHSLLAAQAVSRLRSKQGMESLSILDVYEHPTIEQLARLLETRRVAAPAIAPELSPQVSGVMYRGAAAVQLFALYGIFGLYSMQWLAPYLTYTTVHTSANSDPVALLATLAVMLAVPPAMIVISIIAKWLIIGRYRPGTYPLWGGYYLRWWLVNRILTIAPVGMLQGTPLLNLYYRLMGVRLGHDVHLEADSAQAFDLLSIGSNSTINEDADLSCCLVEQGCLVIGSIRIGERCMVGARSVLGVNSVMQDDAWLEDLSYLPAGSTIAAGSTWVGSPARPADTVRPRDEHAPNRTSNRQTLGLCLAYGAAVLVLPILFVASIFPGVIFINHLANLPEMLAYAPLVALSFILILSLEIIAIKWVLLGRVRPGRYRLHGWLYFRLWLFNLVMGLSQDFLGGLYSTLYFNPWYRLLGARVGRQAELSTLTSACPDLLAVGDQSFLADYSLVGAARIVNGYVSLEPTRIGKRTFIGNSAVVPVGTTMGDDCLLGVLSSAPSSCPAALENHADWLGSPAFRLPKRAASSKFETEQTYEPTRWLYLQRLVFDALRVLLPTTCIVVVSTALLMTALEWSRGHSAFSAVILFPLFYVLFAGLATLVVVILKWALIGRFRPDERPLWCNFVWRNELVTALHENLAEPLFNELLEGTPYAAWFFRLLGANIGKRVYLGTSCFTEYDLVEIGDRVCLNDDCTLQTHLFEDRVMKMSRIRIEAGGTVGPNSIVLYDTHMEEGAVLAALSLLMKGERLPKYSHWEGSPARAPTAPS